MIRRKLGVNIDHIATLRQTRRTRYPDPVHAAAVCELAGASEIKVHLREDRRHIQERDLMLLRETVQTSLNLQIAPTQEMLKVAYDVKPDRVTLVPERREELSTEAGLDIGHHRDHLRKYVASLRDGDIRTVVFIDPDIDQVRGAHRLEVMAVELSAAKLTEARGPTARRQELQKLVDASRAASKLGMRVTAGHRLDYHNVSELVPIEPIEQFNVGHAIMSRAIFVGLEKAVRDTMDLLNPAGAL